MFSNIIKRTSSTFSLTYTHSEECIKNRNNKIYNTKYKLINVILKLERHFEHRMIKTIVTIR